MVTHGSRCVHGRMEHLSTWEENRIVQRQILALEQPQSGDVGNSVSKDLIHGKPDSPWRINLRETAKLFFTCLIPYFPSLHWSDLSIFLFLSRICKQPRMGWKLPSRWGKIRYTEQMLQDSNLCHNHCKSWASGEHLSMTLAQEVAVMFWLLPLSLPECP